MFGLSALNFMEVLPVDCLLKIVEFLPMHVRFKGMSVCKQWRSILSDEQFWIRIGMSLLIFLPNICLTSLALLLLCEAFFDLIFVSDLSPISGLICDEFLKKICRQFGKKAQSLVLDGCHRITGKVLSTIAVLPSLRFISLKWCNDTPFFQNTSQDVAKL